MSRISFAVYVGGVASVLAGVAVGCGTNEVIGDEDGEKDGGANVLHSGGAGNFGGASNTAGGGGGGQAASTSAIGKSCTVDSDCGTGGLLCVKSDEDIFGGGVANGVCTLECTAQLTDDQLHPCRDLDPNTICVVFDDTAAYCLEACVVGPVPAGTRKCHGRSDMACFADEGVNGYCNPVCRGDFDCDGRTCDLSSGFCVDSVEGTLPQGAPCDEKADPDPCKGGFCVGGPVTDGGPSDAVCTGICRLGSVGCGEDPDSTDPLESACLFGATESITGDLGYCAHLCDCNTECQTPTMVCDALPDSLVNTTGRVGLCVDKIDRDGNTVPGIPCTGSQGSGGARGTGGARGAGGAAAPDAGGGAPSDDAG